MPAASNHAEPARRALERLLRVGLATPVELLRAGGQADLADQLQRAEQIVAQVTAELRARVPLERRPPKVRKPAGTPRADPWANRRETPFVQRAPAGFKIRSRTVTVSTATGPHRGPEVQVVGARGRIVARFDTEDQARAWIARQAQGGGA